jgi:hypothetical protein
MADTPVAPEVFDFIDDFMAKGNIWSVAGHASLDSDSSVLAFCENFFAQFFENELDSEITSQEFEPLDQRFRPLSAGDERPEERA